MTTLIRMVEVQRFVNSRFTSNTFILSHPWYDNVWIVDPGNTDNIFDWMENHSKTSVSGILLTHAHFDHIYGVNNILAHFSECKVYIANEYGKRALYDAKMNGSKYTEEGSVTLPESANICFYPKALELWPGVVLHTMYTPGHSDDSQCFYVDGNLFTGDTLIKDIRTVTKLKSGSTEKLEETKNKLSMLVNKSLTVHAGHEESFYFDDYDLGKMTKNSLVYGNEARHEGNPR